MNMLFCRELIFLPSTCLQPIANLSFVYIQLTPTWTEEIASTSRILNLYGVSNNRNKDKRTEIDLRLRRLFDFDLGRVNCISLSKFYTQARYCLQISYPAILYAMLMGFLNRESVIVHALLPGTSKHSHHSAGHKTEMIFTFGVDIIERTMSPGQWIPFAVSKCETG